MIEEESLRFDMIVAGIGGQGVNSLVKVLAEFLQQSGFFCQFTIYKGGAQSLGSVYAELRVYFLANNAEPVVLRAGNSKR